MIRSALAIAATLMAPGLAGRERQPYPRDPEKREAWVADHEAAYQARKEERMRLEAERAKPMLDAAEAKRDRKRKKRLEVLARNMKT